MFKIEAMLQPFEGFLDAPAVMTKIAKQLGWEFAGIQQFSHEHADRGGRTAFITDIGGICRPVVRPAYRRGSAAESVTRRTSDRDSPGVQQEQIATPEAVDLLKEHLPYTFAGAEEGRRQHEIGTLKIQAEQYLVRVGRS